MERMGRVPSRGLGIFSFVFVLTVAQATRADERPDLPAKPMLEDFQRVAELRNPGLESAHREWKAVTEQVRRAGSFPNPHLSFGWFARSVETRVGPQETRLSLRQQIPWFGKLGMHKKSATERARASHARLEYSRLELRRDVALAWFDLYWLGKATRLTRENLELLSNLEKVVRERYRVGSAEYADLVRVQVELSVTEDRLRSLQESIGPVRERMNALLDRTPGSQIPLPQTLPELQAPQDPTLFDQEVQDGSPLLMLRQHGVEEAKIRQRLARRERWPDWTVGLDWIQTGEALNPNLAQSGKDPLVVSVSLELPVFRGKYSGSIQEADEKLAQAHSMRRQQELSLRAQAAAEIFEWQDATRRADLYAKALLPKAQESFEVTLAAYQTGKGVFLDLIEAHRALLEFELELVRANADRGRSHAHLELLTGTARKEEPR